MTKKLLTSTLLLVMILTAACSLLGYFGQHGRMLDMFSHFQLQYLIIFTLGTVLLGFGKKRSAMLFIPFLALAAYQVLPIYFGHKPSLAPSTQTLKIVSINLLSSNREVEKVATYLAKEQPHVVALLEFNTYWQEVLRPALTSYFCRLEVPRSDNFGIALYSKTDIQDLRKTAFTTAGVPSIMGNLRLDGQTMKLIATHPLAPMDTYSFEHRNEQLAAITHFVTHTPTPSVVIGDLNTSSYSVHFKNLQNESNLKDSRKGFGILPSWPTWSGLFETTLDHCLVSEGIAVLCRKVGPEVGSDHLPVMVELQWKTSE